MVKGIEQMRAKLKTHLAAATAAGNQAAHRQSDMLVKAMQFINQAE